MNTLQTDELLYLNQLPILDKINTLKAELDALRPISKEQEGRIRQKFRLDWNYNSNAIEGNSLDYGETTAFLMHGITAKGKPLKDYLDIRGHNNAIDYLLDLAKNKEQPLSESDIRTLHKMLLVEPYDNPAQTKEGFVVTKRIKLGQYKTTPNHVKTVTGEIHYYASPEDTHILMGELIDWYRQVTASDTLHPVIIAAIFHHRFTEIHPFDDGNGRMSRLLMNLILFQYEYPFVVIRNDNKNEYYLALSQADTGDATAFVEYIGSSMLHSLDIYIRGAMGESIEEPLDLDKKLALFKKEIAARKDRVELTLTDEVKFSVLEETIKPLLIKYLIMLSKFDDFFLEHKNYTIDYVDIKSTAKPKQWRYYGIDFKGFTDSLEDFEKKNLVFIASTFERFKLENNPFSLETRIVIVFSELYFSIYYTISEAFDILYTEVII